MAFRTNTAASNAGPANEGWKAQGFLNFYLPSDTPSGRRKLGVFALKASKATERELLEWLTSDPAKTESRVARILSQLIVEFNPAEPAAGTGFKLTDSDEE